MASTYNWHKEMDLLDGSDVEGDYELDENALLGSDDEDAVSLENMCVYLSILISCDSGTVALFEVSVSYQNRQGWSLSR